MMRLIFVNRFYWPETPATGQLLTDLAEALAAADHDVTVLTSAPPEKRASELYRGVKIQRVRSTRVARGGVVGKALDFVTFYFAALWTLRRLAQRDTTVVAMTDPPLLGIGVWLIARWRGASVVHWVQDIYPEVAMAVSGHRWLAMLRPIRNLAWRHAEHCVTIGADMAGLLARTGVSRDRIEIISNWAPSGISIQPREAPNRLRREWQLGGKFVVAYSGNLGRVHDLEPVLLVAESLRHESQIAFVLVGSGSQRRSLEKEARRRGLTNIQFHPAQPRAALAETLAVGDAHLVTLRPGCEHVVFPSKLYGAVAAGRPVVVIAPDGCELARLVAGHDLGHVAERDAIAGIAAFIHRLASDRAAWPRHAAAARNFAARHTFGTALARWSAVLRTQRATQATPASLPVNRSRPQ